MKIQFHARADKELNRLSEPTQGRVRSAIDGLATDCRPAQCKKLKGADGDVYRVRVGDYRIMYVVEDELGIVTVTAIVTRGDAYRKKGRSRKR